MSIFQSNAKPPEAYYAAEQTDVERAKFNREAPLTLHPDFTPSEAARLRMSNYPGYDWLNTRNVRKGRIP